MGRGWDVDGDGRTVESLPAGKLCGNPRSFLDHCPNNAGDVGGECVRQEHVRTQNGIVVRANLLAAQMGCVGHLLKHKQGFSPHQSLVYIYIYIIYIYIYITVYIPI